MEKMYYPALGETCYRYQLSNGLMVMVVPRPGFTKKLAYFVTDYGAIHREFTLDGVRHQTPAGIAHFLEHKLFDMPDRDVSGEFAALGAIPNAFTSYDLTAYYFSCTEHFAESLRLLLEFVSTPYFTEESVKKELGIIGQEIGMHQDNPDSRVFEELMKLMYRNHPITAPILGTEESIAQITPALLHDCHRAFYRPGNMLLCVVGDVDPEQVCSIAEEVLPKQDTAVVTRIQSWQEEMTCPGAYAEHTMEVAMPMFQLGFKVEPPQLGEAAVRCEAIGDLAAELLFGESSGLYLRLYEEGLIDSSFGGGFETVDGMAMLSAGGDSENPEKVRDAILEEARRLVREGIPEADFLRLKRSALGRRLRDLDSFNATAFRICAYFFSGYDYFKVPEVYKTVQIHEILEFLQQAVTEDRCSLCIIAPKEESEI